MTYYATPGQPLTRTHQMIMDLLGQGKTNVQIREFMRIKSKKTMEYHLEILKEYFGVDNTRKLVILAAKLKET